MRNVSFRLFIWFHRVYAAKSDDIIRCLSCENNVFGQRSGDEFPSDFTTTEQPNSGTGELTSASKLSCGHFPICLHMGMDRHIESADDAEATTRNAISYVGFLFLPLSESETLNRTRRRSKRVERSPHQFTKECAFGAVRVEN
jgi:hypothetical protein